MPDDISIVGFDDSAPESEGLSTIHQPLRDKGRVAAERLLGTLADGAPDSPQQPLPTRLVVRSSTRAPNP